LPFISSHPLPPLLINPQTLRPPPLLLRWPPPPSTLPSLSWPRTPSASCSTSWTHRTRQRACQAPRWRGSSVSAVHLAGCIYRQSSTSYGGLWASIDAATQFPAVTHCVGFLLDATIRS
jgi:hypothetical protein